MHTITVNVGGSPLTLQRWQLRHPVLSDPECAREMGLMPGADLGWRHGDQALLFHTTSESSAQQILRDGFHPSPAIEVGGHESFGIPGRVMPPGIWASIRPTVPNDSDTWMPSIATGPWAVLMIRVSTSVLHGRFVFEQTWPLAQFCLLADDLLGVELLAPSEVPQFLMAETLQKISRYREEHHLPSPYLDAIDAAAKASISAS